MFNIKKKRYRSIVVDKIENSENSKWVNYQEQK